MLYKGTINAHIFQVPGCIAVVAERVTLRRVEKSAQKPAEGTSSGRLCLHFFSVLCPRSLRNVATQLQLRHASA